jgi:hypothetical protein
VTPKRLAQIKSTLLSLRGTGFAGEVRFSWNDAADLVDEVVQLRAALAGVMGGIDEYWESQNPEAYAAAVAALGGVT